MTTTAVQAAPDATIAPPGAPPSTALGLDQGPGSGRRPIVPFLTMLVAVAAVIVLPLRGSRTFYLWDDTAAAAAGVWDRMGERALSGQLPILELSMWRGGNFAAEAATGMLNPVMLGLAAATHGIDVLAVRIALVKGILIGIEAIGIYLLAREHRAGPWASAAVGAAICAGGYAIYFDGQAWINGLAVAAFTPWFWVALRRNAHGRGSFLAVTVAAYVLVSTGNPYSMVTLGGVLLAVGIELLAARNWRRFAVLFVHFASALAFAVIMYLPLLMAADVGWRSASQTLNDEFLSPNLSTLLGASMPGYQPVIPDFASFRMTVPAMFIAWFLLPLLPLIGWHQASARWRDLLGPLSFAAVFLLLMIGPSSLWMFRWPLRLIPFVAAAVLVAFAVALTNGGLRVTRGRLGLSFGVVLLGFWIAYSDNPMLAGQYALTGLSVAAGVALVVLARRSRAAVGLVLTIGVVVSVFAQTALVPVNQDVANYDLGSTSAKGMRARFAPIADGLTVEIVQNDDYGKIGNALPIGNMTAVAGLESTTAYSGIGFVASDNALCIVYNGSGCPQMYSHLSDIPAGSTLSVADLMGVQNVIAPAGRLSGRPVPAGWSRVDLGKGIDAIRRDTPARPYGGRVTVATPGVAITGDRVDGQRSETVELTATGADQSLIFARLAWPGYTATLDGKPLPVSTGPIGLVKVDLPADAHGSLVLTFVPDGWSRGIVALVAGWLLALAAAAVEILARRRRAVSGARPRTEPTE